MKVKTLVSRSCLTLLTPWSVACQAPLSMEFSRQGYWSGFLFPPPGDLPDPEIEPGSPALQVDSLPSEPEGNFRPRVTYHMLHFPLSLSLPSHHVTCLMKVTPTLCNPMDPTIVHGILQARILDWVAFPFSRGSSQPRDQTQVSHIVGGFFTS